MPNEMQVPEGLMDILIWLAAIYTIQVLISLVYVLLEVNGWVHRDRAGADQTEDLPDDTEWEVRA